MSQDYNSTEEWRDIPGYNGVYKVSNHGRISSNKSGRVTILNGTNRYGYIIVRLYELGKWEVHRVHRLVLSAFNKNKHDCKECNHIDGNKANNNIDNLEWCSRKGNMQHSINVLNNTPHRILTEEDVYKSRELYMTGGYSFAEIGKMFNVSGTAIRDAVHGITWSFLQEQLDKDDLNRVATLRKSKLTQDSVHEVRRLYSTGEYNYNKISKIFNVSRSQIRRIILRERWKHV